MRTFEVRIVSEMIYTVHPHESVMSLYENELLGVEEVATDEFLTETAGMDQQPNILEIEVQEIL